MFSHLRNVQNVQSQKSGEAFLRLGPRVVVNGYKTRRPQRKYICMLLIQSLPTGVP
jgi:hypothetical protein